MRATAKTYVVFARMGNDSGILGKQFYIFYTSYPNNEPGASNGAPLKRFTAVFRD